MSSSSSSSSSSASSAKSRTISTAGSSFRIGSKNIAATTESTILRSLREVRLDRTSLRNEEELVFWNCTDFSPMTLHSLRKLLLRDGRRFATIKFYFASEPSNANASSRQPTNRCPIRQRQQQQRGQGQDEDTINDTFAQVLTMILDSNCTKELIIKGGNAVTIPSSFSKALCDGLATNTSVTSFRLIDQQYLSDNFAAALSTSLMVRNSRSNSDNNSNNTESTTLRSLTLSGCHLDDASLSQIIRSSCCNTDGAGGNVVELNLSRNHAANGALEAIADALASSSSSCCLESLNMSHQTLPMQEPVDGAIQHEQQQRKLLEATITAFSSALDALATNTTVANIDISGNPLLFAEPVLLEALCRCLVNNQSLVSVDVSIQDGIPSPALQYLAQHCLPHCGIGGKNSNNHNLTTLVLFGSDVTATVPCDNGATTDAIVQGMQSNCTLISLGNTTGNVRIQHCLDMNRAGRAVLRFPDGDGGFLPLGIWSNILARATAAVVDGEDDEEECDETNVNEGNRRTASVLFTLLRGPALLEQRCL